MAKDLKPKNIQELGLQLMQAARDVNLGKRSHKVLVSMVEEPHWAAMSTITEIANVNGVNPSTVTRIATKIGFSGFNDLQDEFRRLIINPAEIYSSQVIEAILHDTSSNNEEDSILKSVVESEVQNTLSTFEESSSDRIKKVAKLIAKARRVRVLGLRQCYSLAHFLSYALHLLRDGVAPLGSSGHTLAENIPDLTERDILVAISFKPYTRDVIDTCSAAHAAGVAIVMISDSYDAPLPHDHAFIVATKGPFFLSGMTAAFVLSEVLLLLTAKAIGQKALRRLHQMERLFENMNVERR